MKTRAAALALLLTVFLPAGGRAAPDSLEAIEKDLSTILSEMDAVRAELDRIAELSSVPKATGVRIEIHGGAGAAPPAAVRLLVGGKIEDERDVAKADRDAFAGGSPLVVEIPFLPGTYKARIELSHPYWKERAAAEFPIGLRAGETAQVRLRLSAPGAKSTPALTPMEGK